MADKKATSFLAIVVDQWGATDTLVGNDKTQLLADVATCIDDDCLDGVDCQDPAGIEVEIFEVVGISSKYKVQASSVRLVENK